MIDDEVWFDGEDIYVCETGIRILLREFSEKITKLKIEELSSLVMVADTTKLIEFRFVFPKYWHNLS